MTSEEEATTITTIREASRAEKRLLREEYDAEIALVEARKELSEALEKLQKEQKRVERRREKVIEATAALRAARDARAAGPNISEPEPVKNPEPAPPPKDDSSPARRRKVKAPSDGTTSS